MIRAFLASKRVAVIGMIISTIIGIIIGIMAYLEWIAIDISVVALLWFVATSVAWYLARIVAVREYQKLLFLMYEKMDIDAFLEKAIPILDTKMSITQKVNHAVHVANAYLVQGEERLALELLQMQIVPPQNLELQGLICANTGTAYLQGNDQINAKKTIKELEVLVQKMKRKDPFRKKLLHVIAYQQLCLRILNGQTKDQAILEADYQNSRSLIHKRNSGLFLLKIYELTKEKAKQSEIKQFLKQFKTSI